MPVTKVPQNVWTIVPTTGIAPTAVFVISSDTMVPATTLAPVARIFAAARILSPGGRQSGLNKRIFVAETRDDQDCLRILTRLFAVVKKCYIKL